MFRYERPQAGRTRQFHQAGVEAFGSDSPLLDVETIDLAAQFFDAIGLAGYEIRINSIGCAGCRSDFRKELRSRLESRRGQLCENCQRRFERNVFRILDCKEEACRAIIMTLPVVADHLCPACAQHWQEVQAGLKALGQPYVHDPHLVRGLDYYTRTVYEFIHGGLGARNAVCGGGRYDNLIGELGGSGPAGPVGGIGFAVGFEPTIAALSTEAREHATKAGVSPGLDAYVVRASDGAGLAALQLAQELRRAGFSCDLDYEGRSLKAQMRSANRTKARFALILGEDELSAGNVTVRDLASATQESVPRAGLTEWLRARSPAPPGSPG
jgi:histidyl-tRNA synthetase